jgi:hypothetical protein
MTEFVIEHVKVSDLPEPWRAKLANAGNAWVTVRIEAEAGVETESAFGMWSDRQDLADVAGYVRSLRAPRFTRD